MQRALKLAGAAVLWAARRRDERLQTGRSGASACARGCAEGWAASSSVHDGEHCELLARVLSGRTSDALRRQKDEFESDLHHVDVARATSALYAQARKLASLEFSLNGQRERARTGTTTTTSTTGGSNLTFARKANLRTYHERPANDLLRHSADCCQHAALRSTTTLWQLARVLCGRTTSAVLAGTLLSFRRQRRASRICT